MNEETPKDTRILNGMLMSKANRQHVTSLLRDIVHDKEGDITLLKEKVEKLYQQLNEKLSQLVAKQTVHLALQRELTIWEEPKHEESDRDPSPF